MDFVVSHFEDEYSLFLLEKEKSGRTGLSTSLTTRRVVDPTRPFSAGTYAVLGQDRSTTRLVESPVLPTQTFDSN